MQRAPSLLHWRHPMTDCYRWYVVSKVAERDNIVCLRDSEVAAYMEEHGCALAECESAWHKLGIR